MMPMNLIRIYIAIYPGIFIKNKLYKCRFLSKKRVQSEVQINKGAAKWKIKKLDSKQQV